MLCGHRHVCGPWLTETSLCGMWLSINESAEWTSDNTLQAARDHPPWRPQGVLYVSKAQQSSSASASEVSHKIKKKILLKSGGKKSNFPTPSKYTHSRTHITHTLFTQQIFLRTYSGPGTILTIGDKAVTRAGVLPSRSYKKAQK